MSANSGKLEVVNDGKGELTSFSASYRSFTVGDSNGYYSFEVTGRGRSEKEARANLEKMAKAMTKGFDSVNLRKKEAVNETVPELVG